MTRDPPCSIVRVEMSHMPWAESYATLGSDAACSGPGGVDSTVTAGSSPRLQVRPESFDTAKPMNDAPPVAKRSTW